MKIRARELLALPVVFVLVELGAFGASVTEFGNTDVHLAVMDQAPDTLEALLQGGTSANAENKRRRVPLHYAVLAGTTGSDYSAQMTRVLLRYGADPNMVDDSNLTPLDIAISRGSPAVVRLLLEYGANPNRVHRNGYSLLTTAMMHGRDDVARLLQEFGAMHGVSAQEQGLVQELPRMMKFSKGLRNGLELSAFVPEAFPGIVARQVSLVYPEMSAEAVKELVEQAAQLAEERKAECRQCRIRSRGGAK